MNKINRWKILECVILLEDKSQDEIRELNFFSDQIIAAAQKLFDYLKELEDFS